MFWSSKVILGFCLLATISAFEDLRRKPFYRNKRSAIDNTISTTIPASFDFRTYGKVTPVKNQKGFPQPNSILGDCESAWAHAATAAIESQYLLRYNQSLDLSEQFLVDCELAHLYGCWGGADTRYAFEFVKTNGIPLESCLPYVANENNMGMTCSNCPNRKQIAGFRNYGFTEAQIVERLYNYGPTTATFWVPEHMSSKIRAYKSGVWDVTAADCAAMKPSDCLLPYVVLIVGYTPDYWIAKNSWGATWGEAGYIRLKRTTNFCGTGLENVFAPYLNVTTCLLPPLLLPPLLSQPPRKCQDGDNPKFKRQTIMLQAILP